MDIQAFQGARVTVMGLGRFASGSGVGAAKWLVRHGAKVTITDLKSQEELKNSFEEVQRWYEIYRSEVSEFPVHAPSFMFGEHREEDFLQAQAVFQNPDVPLNNRFIALAKDQHIPIYSDVSLFLQLCPYPVTAVTGTRGKTTTTSLIGAMYRAEDPQAIIAGNITRSPLEDLDELLDHDVERRIVLELSSALIDTLDALTPKPAIAVFTNLSPDHLNRYGSFEAYRQSKEALFLGQSAGQFSLLNASSDAHLALAPRLKSQTFWFSFAPLASDKRGAFVQDEQIVFRGTSGIDEVLMPLNELALQGEHNQQNALAAVCAAKLAGVTDQAIINTLKQFRGVPHRQEVLGEVNGVTFVNDTTATSPEGAIAALKRFGVDKKIVLLAGGATKNLPLQELAKVIHDTCKQVILFEGTATDEFVQAIGGSVPYARVGSMPEAITCARSLARAGDVVLLSPGTASFGIFKNEFDRGDQFVAAVKDLLTQET